SGARSITTDAAVRRRRSEGPCWHADRAWASEIPARRSPELTLWRGSAPVTSGLDRCLGGSHSLDGVRIPWSTELRWTWHAQGRDGGVRSDTGGGELPRRRGVVLAAGCRRLGAGAAEHAARARRRALHRRQRESRAAGRGRRVRPRGVGDGYRAHVARERAPA